MTNNKLGYTYTLFSNIKQKNIFIKLEHHTSNKDC